MLYFDITEQMTQIFELRNLINDIVESQDRGKNFTNALWTVAQSQIAIRISRRDEKSKSLSFQKAWDNGIGPYLQNFFDVALLYNFKKNMKYSNRVTSTKSWHWHF